MATDNSAALPQTQKGICLHAAHSVQLDGIPVPQIEQPDDAIVKVLLAGLCGSDLHPYRGHKFKDTPPFVMGHELYGEIVQLGSSFASVGATSVENRPKGYATYRVGMKVIATFSVSCLECEYCAQGFTSRCVHSELLGSPTLPGAQAQYIRIPKAGGTLIEIHTASTSSPNYPVEGVPKAGQGETVPVDTKNVLAGTRIPHAGDPLLPNQPSNAPASNSTTGTISKQAVGEGIIPPEIAILLADILPTGYFAALQAYQHPNLAFSLGSGVEGLVDRVYAEEAVDVPEGGPGGTRMMTFAVIGLGPVGVCALVALIDFMLLHLDASQSPAGTGNDAVKKRKSLAFRVLAMDLLESRIVQAQDVARKIQDPRVGVSTHKESGASNSRSTSHPIHVEFMSPDQAPPDSCHAVLEVVGHPSTLTLSASLSRPFGIISSVGVHAHPTFPLPAPLLYDKNLSFAFGRCPVRALLPRSKAVLERRKEAFEGFVERVVGIGEASEAYQRFEKGEGGKVCFDPWN